MMTAPAAALLLHVLFTQLMLDLNPPAEDSVLSICAANVQCQCVQCQCAIPMRAMISDVNPPDGRPTGVEPEECPSLTAALKAGQPVRRRPWQPPPPVAPSASRCTLRLPLRPTIRNGWWPFPQVTVQYHGTLADGLAVPKMVRHSLSLIFHWTDRQPVTDLPLLLSLLSSLPALSLPGFYCLRFLP